MYKLLIICVAFLVTCVVSQPQTPMIIYVKMFMNQLNKIDGVEQTFSSDFYLTTYWEDSTIVGDAFDPAAHWNPSLEFVNVMGEATAKIEEPWLLLRGADIDDTLYALSTSGVPRENQTWVKGDQRYVGDFITPLKLYDFPFDKQNAILMMESALYNNVAVQIQPYPTMVQGDLEANMLPKDFEVVEWKLFRKFRDNSAVSVSNSNNFYPVFGESYSQLRFDIALEREATYYLWKIVSGVILLVYMCIMVIALAVDEPDRMMGTLTVFLALVSFTFITGNDVPKVAYQTRIDVFTSFSFFTTFFIMIEHCFNYVYQEYLGEDNEHTAKRDIQHIADMKGLHGASRFFAKFRSRYSGVRTRKVDGWFALAAALFYAIGVAIIFGRPTE